MKNIKTILSLLILTGIIMINTACKNNKEKENLQKNEQKTTDDKSQDYSNFIPVLKNYFELKDALVNSDQAVAQNAGINLINTISDFDKNPYPEKEDKISKILLEAKQQAKMIAEGSLEKQRMSFKKLSENISNFVTLTGTNQTIYLDFCPMYNNGKGGMWLSTIKKIKNPYYGDKMKKCGTVQNTINP